ncbi:MAG: diphthine--ammonia ligase [Actinomycetota bacterium]|nr:diphthine--ammonia ligase [Actinomycetota bacterium]
MMFRSIKGLPFFCSWSGGKDSCLALYHALLEGGSPRYLLTMLRETGDRSRSHGNPVELLHSQARSLGVPIITGSATWEGYEESFLSLLRELRKDGVETGVFGDIDLEEHRRWIERVCSLADIQPFLPLWKRERPSLLREFIDAGFEATIVTVKEGVLPEEFLGKTLDADTVREMEKTGIDLSGEAGEYHTFVSDGPIFDTAVEIAVRRRVLVDGYWFLDVGSRPR